MRFEFGSVSPSRSVLPLIGFDGLRSRPTGRGLLTACRGERGLLVISS